MYLASKKNNPLKFTWHLSLNQTKLAFLIHFLPHNRIFLSEAGSHLFTGSTFGPINLNQQLIKALEM
jgi:hypothetical protein